MVPRWLSEEVLAKLCSSRPSCAQWGLLPLGSGGGSLHLEGWVILVHLSHRADIKRSPGQMCQAAGANVLLWATSEGLLACLGHLDGCGAAGGL